jgi:hypothetical protein
MNSPVGLRARALLVTGIAVCGLATAAPVGLHAASAAAPAVAPGTLQVSGSAFGTYARIGDTAKAGTTASIGFGGGCSLNGQQLPIHVQNSVASVSIPELGSSTEAISTTGDATETADTLTVRTTADVHGVDLLGGLVTAREVTAVSTTTFDGSGFHTSADGSGFADLIVAGTPIDANVPPNTTIKLRGIGQVVLNEQTPKQKPRSAGLTVNMIHVRVTHQNALGYPVGSEVIVASATTAITQPRQQVVATLDGHAYGSRVTGKVVSPAIVKLKSGSSAPVSVPCRGTDGEVRANFVANVVVPSDGSVLDADTIRTTAQGSADESSATVETTATVESAAVLGSLVRATAIRADAHASSSGASPSFGDDGSGFGTLSVSGHPEIGADVPANTSVEIAGLGTLWLHRVIETQSSIEVRMIELIVTRKANSFGLAVGTDIRVAVAEASIHNT